jgi:3-hydroxyacyl-[acyl-carrier-protein] dehydratase
VVTPGDKLELHVKVDKRKGPIWRLAAEAKVDGQVASEALIMATIADAPKDKP